MHGLNDHSSIQQVVSSNGHDDLLLMSAYNQFSAFKEKYNKTYLTQEEDDYRFGVFMSNLHQARRNQILDPTVIHGVTKFSDLMPSSTSALTCTDDKRICNLGCKGGNYVLAHRYMLKVGGVEATKDYPYTGIDGSCKFDKNKIVPSIYEFNNIVADEDQFAANLVEYGTVAVGINGDMLQTYTGGIACPPCSGTLNHALTLVGYGSDRHWIIKNSFGTNFGENGYYRLCKGRLTCGENPVAAFPLSA
ncbi:hypothetical protein JRO89_XS07G0030600 [Xanthoceras sorbifolium]|uniref:Cysteine proteinase n=1 Tax=Xanthoceras sorbifolium TaxID=99658 RepID=A0ABQ8HS88_9ROSI|nr:hypothetical protein JRO89_XS07G0030600 [Xanthoceras sorbifolium]